MNAVIHTHALARNFGRTVALAGVDLDVPEGAIYALVGANGAGKTTLIKVLMNIFQPSSGSATVLGVDSRLIAGKHFTKIGYVSENQEMPEWMTVRGLLDYYRNFYPEWDTALEQQLIRQFNLPLDRKLKHMSRGQRMKAAFASSLAYRPSLIVLDEPLSGLDPLVRDELIDGLLERAPETTVFLSSHDLAEIEGFSSHVGYLENGRLLFSEEMTSLTARFREVTVTLAEPVPRPFPVPPHWLQCESVDRVLRFVHSRYEPAAAQQELAAMFPGARDIAVEPMSLRAIFLAVAKSGRAQPVPVAVAAEPRELNV
ncbi:ABC transporter ATP-binding protein [Occallatibacter riparius]|uniref:ABC transporter ATP-binding protein n=1 Tax=Occallatibacter riparius TaxID=1002689 RepID=A0A9J7BIV7_9BACT|nr:ABC transporter ATP-binding protein [Occallatibacter riparius]UWZ82744.1 ABC transporter ATP-binding protein [Occallatibacter riparius]